MSTAKVHSFESFGAVDGPGVRFVVFLQGCPLRCRYCHNPDTWKRDAGEEYDVDTIVRRALRYRSYWASDGGVTVSGGEALLQIDFLTDFFKALKQEKVNTCLDTAAGPFRSTPAYLAKFDELMRYTDLVLLDLKHSDSAAHRELTGVPNDNILECARHLDELGVKMWIRHVIVPGITTDEGELTELARFIATLRNVDRVEALPYHSLGVHKWDVLGIPYTLRDTPAPTGEQLERARRILGAV